MFRGTFDQKLDDKGRVNIPSKFRDVLRELGDDRIVITNLCLNGSRCLEARPYAEWMKLEARIAERTDLSAEAMDYYDTFYLPGAQECQVDPQGRLLVPTSLRLYAGLVKDVVFTGSRTKFRIWDRPKYEAVRDAGEQLGATDPRVRNELGL